tara:strand:+ start:2795 stop:3028 length:234 start_codon:yes stop_codon:yes gene_type:complete
MNSFRDKNWTKFWLHFAFGAVIGMFIGIGIFSQSEYASSTSGSNTPLILTLGISGIAVGVLAGVYGDELWAEIHKMF